ncbi:hypothetical protein [Actinokineospora globicatena]|uniref:hypothetical protein n=1 Tax=Actinokineospora globicatena TaxID=103729 RepID=UPI0020A3F1C0|nr:hypothetical protein [Actinokineospora globicatena]MCP2303646.1 hypothetical protein [Actinokineospora globicatena]GLW79217.1 hypothetical protein Aglo01_36990 [Actinokineospora globicatena]GLW86373.1 hypothetical protein Aglo02_40120 [Actinokineospora globicatena]
MTILAGIVRDLPVQALELCGVTWSGEFLWYSESFTGQITAVDAVTGARSREIACDDIRADLTTMDGYLVQVVGERRDLRMLSPETGAVVAEFANPRPGHTLTGLEACRDGLWLGYADLKVLDLRDSSDFHLIDCVAVRRPPAGVTVSDGYLVYSDHGGSMLTVVDTATRREQVSVRVWGKPSGLTWDGSLIWYCDQATLQLRAVELPGFQRS